MQISAVRSRSSRTWKKYRKGGFQEGKHHNLLFGNLKRSLAKPCTAYRDFSEFRLRLCKVRLRFLWAVYITESPFLATHLQLSLAVDVKSLVALE